MSGRLRLSVVMPTYNRADVLPAALAPLLADEDIDEVVVIVDGSKDRTESVLRALAATHPKLRPIVTPNRGQSAARALGAHSAIGDVLLFLDDDLVASDELAARHLAFHEAEPDLVVSGYAPVVVPRRRRPGNFPTFLAAEEYEASCARVESTGADVLTGLWGSNFSMRRTDYLRVAELAGEFASKYHEDMDFGIWCLRAGLHGRLERSLVARHNHVRSVASFRREARSQGTGLALVLARHAGLDHLTRRPDFEAGLPFPARSLLHIARRPRAGRVAISGLAHGVRVAGALHAYGLETALGKLIRRLEQQAAFLDTNQAVTE